MADENSGDGGLFHLISDLLNTVRRYIKIPVEPGSPAPGSTGEEARVHYARPAMNASRAREQALGELRSLLFGATTGATIHITTRGQVRPRRLDWPEDPGERQPVWAHLEATLRMIQQDGAVRIKAHGAARGCYCEVPWPAMPGLFPEEEPPVGPAREVSKAPTGEERKSPAISAIEPGADVRKSPKASDECAKHILRVLFDTQERHTGERLVEAMSKRPDLLPYSESTVEATATWLRRRGILTNDIDGKGRGYGLASWDVDPAPVE